MTFANRIIQPNGHTTIIPYVVLKKDRGEYDNYHGCGWVIAEIDGDTIFDLFYLGDENEEALHRILQKAGLGGEFWLAEASCYQLCNPVRISPENPQYFARALQMYQEETAIYD